MGLRVVGAGVGRTGTDSLKRALGRLLGGPCHHMVELFAHPEQLPTWEAAVAGTLPDWSAFLGDYVAAVDFPSAAFWRELSDANPDAVVLLSTRASADVWWTSADATIFAVARRGGPPGSFLDRQLAMATALLTTRFSPNWSDERAAKEAYDAHNQAVRDGVAPDRLLEWRPGDGWGPICAALDVAVPDEPFPHTNTTADFRAMLEL
jgi:hypothetical protein